ncbi:hypothetical protein L6164_032643 [Bauhinia variegata]|uniref:Uncharacterized protein n=1 Tax=Bauhinia variegata TaxID=167791 RepID=A0ACB9KQ53_BAUVA|nr:hypothetical protein L6164_032643 [Bauhinia variegata]
MPSCTKLWEIKGGVKSSEFEMFFAFLSMEQVFERYNLHSEVQSHSSRELQIESESYNKLRKEAADKTHELRQLNGEELQGCSLRELQKLEEQIKMGLRRVSKAKDERLVRDISVLKRKGVQMMQENRQLKRRVACEQGQSSEPITICSLSDSPQDHDCSDTSLKLGLPNYK